MEDRLVGLLINNEGVTVTGPIGIVAYCFDETGKYLYARSTYTVKDTAEPNEQVPFQIDLYGDPCPIYLVVASGYGPF